MQTWRIKAELIPLDPNDAKVKLKREYEIKLSLGDHLEFYVYNFNKSHRMIIDNIE